VADAAGDFVRDRTDAGGEFFGRNFVCALPADDRHLVVERGTLNVGHIDERQIHADAAHNRSEFTAHQHAPAVGQGTRQTVFVTDGERRDAALTAGYEGAAVTERRALGDRL